MPPQTLEQALATLPPLTLAVEEAVHGAGVSPEAVARALRVSPAEVRVHLDVARQVRAQIAFRREEDGVRVTLPSAVPRSELDERIVALARGRAGAREISRRLGCGVATAVLAIRNARARGEDIPWLAPRPAVPRPKPRLPAPNPAAPTLTAWLDAYCPAPTAD